MKLPVTTFDLNSFSGLIGFPNNSLLSFHSFPRTGFLGLVCYDNKIILSIYELSDVKIYQFPQDAKGFESLFVFIKQQQLLHGFDKLLGCSDMEFVKFFDKAAKSLVIDWSNHGLSKDTFLNIDFSHLCKKSVEAYSSIILDSPVSQSEIAKLFCGIAADTTTFKFLTSKTEPPSLKDLFDWLMDKKLKRNYVVGGADNDMYGYRKSEKIKLNKLKKDPNSLSVDFKIFLERFNHLPSLQAQKFAFLSVCKKYNIFFGYCTYNQ